MKKKLAAALTVLAALSVGCGDDDQGGGGGESEQTPSSSQPESAAPEVDPADQAIADAALLTLDDFPAGWEAEPADDEATDVESQRRIAECVGVDFEDLYSAGGNASAESPTFISPDEVEISSNVKVAADEPWAANAFEIAAGPKFSECMLEETRKTVEEAAAEEDIEIGEPTINPMSFDDYGDDTLAFRLTVPFEVQGLSLEITGDFILVRVGRAQTTVTTQSTGSPYDIEELSALTKLASDRLAKEL